MITYLNNKNRMMYNVLFPVTLLSKENKIKINAIILTGVFILFSRADHKIQIFNTSIAVIRFPSDSNAVNNPVTLFIITEF